MIIIYSTSEVAKIAGIHPNTVRWYEKMKYLPPVNRKKNGYRVFNDTHLEQLKLIKIAFRCEVLQSNLRNKAIEIILICADGKYEEALTKAEAYHLDMCNEKAKAEEAVEIIRDFINYHNPNAVPISLKRNEAAKHLGITIDTLRNWELNGLIDVKRKTNGYRFYTDNDIRELKIIRVLRDANYSLMSILRMLQHLRNDSNHKDLRMILDTPPPDEDIVYVTDKLLTSLSNAQEDTKEIIRCISKLK